MFWNNKYYYCCYGYNNILDTFVTVRIAENSVAVTVLKFYYRKPTSSNDREIKFNNLRVVLIPCNLLNKVFIHFFSRLTSNFIFTI